MAESIVQVNSGSGPKLHSYQRTIGSNNVEDEVVLFGEPYLASYTVSADASAATANSHLLQLMAGSTNKTRVRRIEIWQETVATAAAIMDTRLYRLTTAGTGGTVQGENALDPSDGGYGGAAMTLPTVKGTEGGFIALARPYLIQTIGASLGIWQPILVWDFDRLRSKPLMIAAGTANGIAIKNVTAHAAAQVRITVFFDESNF